ncbi:hypothetical protein FEM48_Zijuj02G0160100 [Ziziphus jujuba var. spinosa]|uniref:Uncharacterized protein n=1 Tax=Ziziphus jujuba var. spinosa TaxID=714518 RepID=A0A978VWL5_ZIZJJ|nr:hypothetical protein FEM48_Zijuj02G0160100 [Ziziphus jujuba var. spinosa]
MVFNMELFVIMNVYQITILVAADGVRELPVISGSENLKEALQKLGFIPSSRILAVEVLWTSQNENDSLPERNQSSQAIGLEASSAPPRLLPRNFCQAQPVKLNGGGPLKVNRASGAAKKHFAFKALGKPAITAVLLGLLLMYYCPNSAFAASGGRVGAAFALVYRFLSNKFHGSVVTATEKTSVVLKLQVGLSGRARQLQRELNRIADIADTSSPKGLSYVLTETTVALLQHPDDCISGYSAVDLKRSMEDCEERFDQLSVEERGKFDEETLVNVNNIKRQRTSSQGDSGFSNEYIVITILVAAKGVHKLPVIRGSENLKEALQKLGSIPSSRILAVEVLWTPQNENDCLSEQELLEDYPLLRPL